MAIFLGCSSNPQGTPVTPPEPDEQPGLTGQNAPGENPTGAGHAMWGLWQGMFDPEKGEFEVVALRDAQFHVNVVNQLQPPRPPGLSIVINTFDPPTGFIDIDLTIKHPFPDSNLRGFDVRGIVMGAGNTINSQLDAGIIYAAPDGFRLANPDGYSRWWNAAEFTTEGFYGFTPGHLGFMNFRPEATLNPYKVFSDPLGPEDPVVPKVNMSNRGTFSTDPDPPELTRNYQLYFPMGPGGNPNWLFQYAVDANWAPPTGSSPPPKPIDDFPIEANCPEAFHISVNTQASTAWFVDNANYGGDLVMDIEIFDWAAPSNPDGIDGEIQTIFIESETLFDSIVNVPVTSSPGTQPTSGVYTITVPDLTPTALEDQEVLITVRSADPTTYAPPIGGPTYPTGASLAAYALVEVPISDTEPEPGTLTVISPNGGEVWDAGSSEEITWQSEGPVGDNVKLVYTIADSDPQTITTSTPNDGSFTWDPIPDIENEYVRVVVSSVEDPSITDQSDEYFTITRIPQPEITVTRPNGGEIWIPGDAERISWTSEGDVGFEVRIDYTIADGAPVNIVSFTDNDDDYLWVPIPDIESEEVKILITSIDNPDISDESDDFFTITSTPEPTIFVDIPNGGEVWEAGGADEITWTSIGDVGPEVRIDYTVEDGAPVNIVSTTTNDGSYTWDPIADIDSEFVKIRVSSFIDPAVFDDSDDYFTIQPPVEPVITVTVPNGGEFWESGSAQDIHWTSEGPVGPEVWVDYSVSDGPPNPIAGPIANTGTFTWDPIPNIENHEVRVIVTDVSNPAVSDESDEYFSIGPEPEPRLIMVSPNGGEIWESGTAQQIDWISEGPVGDNVRLEYTVSDAMTAVITDLTANTGSYSWDPVPDIDSDEVRVQVFSIDNPSVWDESDEYFTITPAAPSIRVLTPNGGEDWEIGTTQTIEWTSENLTGGVKIEYTTSDFEIPVTLVEDTEDDGSWDWDPVIGPATEEARVYVTSVDNPSVMDNSDEHFTIYEPESLTLTSPNGGENLDGNGTWEITWDSTGMVDFVNLVYSTDSGGTYPNTIVSGTENDGSYTWDPVPNIDTTTARVKVEWEIDPGVNDESDGDFTITAESLSGWNPIPGLTGLSPDPSPDQGDQDEDIMVFSEGTDQSRGEIVDETDNRTFWKFEDAYNATTGTSWEYPEFASPLHKFDVSMDGNWVFVSNANPDSFPNEQVNDPMFCAYSCCDNSNGDFSDEFWHIYADTGDPDPDDIPWRRLVDFSCGVPGGIDDTTSYHMAVWSNDGYEPNPQPHDGNIIFGAWDEPYDGDSLTFYLLDVSTQGGGQGLVDDTDPGSMALAVDDNTGLLIEDEPVAGLWVLDSIGIVQGIAMAFGSGDVVFLETQLTGDQYGTSIPVDIEFAPALDFGYEVTDPGFNWLVALLDNGDDSWSVGVWEFNYTADPTEFVLIDITDPLPGHPMAVDVDGTDFEIHVLADNAGTVEVTVLNYTP